MVRIKPIVGFGGCTVAKVEVMTKLFNKHVWKTLITLQ